MKSFTIEITKSGLPSMWEKGGGWSNKGDATIITGEKGEKLKPLTIGHRCNENHALFVIRKGYKVIMASHWRDEVNVEIYEIENIDIENKKVECKCTNTFDKGTWDIEPSEDIDIAVKEVVKKCYSYHCREVFWAKPFERRY